MEETRVQVNFGSDVYGSFVLSKKRGRKIYQSQKVADRYIKQWLAQRPNHACQCYDFAKGEWFTWYQQR
jgi:hypothetical protein